MTMHAFPVFNAIAKKYTMPQTRNPEIKPFIKLWRAGEIGVFPKYAILTPTAIQHDPEHERNQSVFTP